jgi:hypothetical protein
MRLAPGIPTFDPTTVVAYYLTPEDENGNHRGIKGLGGLVQLQRGGAGYAEVHPLEIARDMRMLGLKIPAELERYCKVLDLGLSLHDAIAAWEASRLPSAAPPEEKTHPLDSAGPLPPSKADVEISTTPDLRPVTPAPDDVTPSYHSQVRSDERQNMVRDQVFISYCHKDQKFLNDLLTHLKPYLRKGTFTTWSDQQIEPGSQWLDEIKAALAKTSVAVMLVSPGFLDSDFIHEHELGPFLKEAAAGGVTILWVLIRDCSYEETPLKDYQAVVSPPGKPFASMPKAKRDTAWKAVCQAIKEVVNRP